jgi:signal transduction histidine kinase
MRKSNLYCFAPDNTTPRCGRTEQISMQNSAPTEPPVEATERDAGPFARLLAYLPRGNTLDERSWQRRHRLLEWVLLLHVPLLVGMGLLLGNSPLVVGYTLIAPVVGLVLGHVLHRRRLASFFVTGGLVFCSAGLVVLTKGTIEAHFHFFIIIGFIALYQDWVPFLWNVGFTVISHGIGTIWLGNLIFNHPAAQANPWLWSGIHGVAVLVACVGMVIFWRVTEDEQSEKEALGRQLITADAEIGRRRFTADMLVNLARRNQSMLYRQLEIINQLEEKERDPDALANLFTLDHLATRVRRNAENLLVLAGEQPPRTWSAPVPLRDVVRAAIAETEDLDRVVFAVDDRVSVAGHAVADLTHLLAELAENAVRFSPPDTAVTVRARPDRRVEGAHLLTIEDWGVGMPPDDLAAANELLAQPHEVDLAVAQRLGFHVVSRLASRHGISVSLGTTPGQGITAVVALPAALFPTEQVDAAFVGTMPEARPYVAAESGRRGPRVARLQEQTGWIEPVSAAGAARASNGARPPTLRQRETTGWTEPEPFTDNNGRRGSESFGDWWKPASTTQAEGDGRGAEAVGGGHAGNGYHASYSQPDRSGALPSVPGEPIPRPRGRAAEPDASVNRRELGPAAAGPAPDGQDASSRRGLRRRVPQANLAPELRQPSDGAGPVAPPDGGAASALSRYQASRQAAQALVDDSGTAGGK